MSIFRLNNRSITFATLTKPGKRATNEDACGYWIDTEGACFVVSDGAGGNGGGDVASEMAVKTLLSSFYSNPSLEAGSIQDNILKADSAIRYGQSLSTSLNKMSATIATLFIEDTGESCRIAHLGDTRIYFFRRKQSFLLTKDHSMLQQFIDAGIVNNQSAEGLARNRLIGALGGPKEVEAVISENLLGLHDGDAFLICTDGFWESINEETMLKQLELSTAIEEWLARMDQNIIKSDSVDQDNYTALAVWINNPNDITLTWQPHTSPPHIIF